MMDIISTEQLRDKDVINLCDGSKLGRVCELEFEVCSGKICSLIIFRDNGFFCFGKTSRLTVPWNKIECIGEDTLLVKIPANDLPDTFKQRE